MPNKRIISDVIIKRAKKEPASQQNDSVFNLPPKATAPQPDVIQKSPVKKYQEKEFPAPYPRIQFKPISTKPKVGGKGIKLVALVLFITVFFVTVVILIALKSSSVEVVLTLKSLPVDINRSVILARPAAAGAVEFSTLALQYPMSGLFTSGEKKSMESKAEGTVVIFNKNSKDPQVLIASTRLETPDGKIYRIPSTVIIPGTRTENGKVLPGSKEVLVIADKSGAEYNIGLTDFTIPGFKGSQKYENFFARSKTEMTGGYIGNSQLVSKSAVDSAVAELTAEANKNLKNIIEKKLPDGTIILPGSEEYAVLNIETNPKIGSPIAEGQKFEVKINAEVRGAIVKENDFAKAAVKNDVEPSLLGGGEFRIINPEALELKISGYKYNGNSLKIDVKGNANVEAFVEIDEAKNKLSNADVKSAADILALFPAVFRAELNYHPFWVKSLPGRYLDPIRRGRIDIVIAPR